MNITTPMHNNNADINRSCQFKYKKVNKIDLEYRRSRVNYLEIFAQFLRSFELFLKNYN